MKAHREPPKFTPVTLVLETQEEVDAIYVFLRHRMSIHAGIPEEEKGDLLAPFVSKDAWGRFSEAFKTEWELKRSK